MAKRKKRHNRPRQREAISTFETVLGYGSLWGPPSKLPLSEWADKYRVLSSESSAEPGQWVTSKAPYEKAIMDAISDAEVPRIAVQKASQLGLTDLLLNAIGYYASEEPCPILLVQPTIEMGETFSTDRLVPMVRDSPTLRKLFAEPVARNSQNTMRRKSFPGGYVAIAGANSAASLSGRPVRVVLLDDVDRYSASAGTEGNPLQLAIARTSAFWNRKVVIVSSPGIKGVSHIEREMEQSTCEFWYLPCPECGCYQMLDWDRIRFADVTHRCIECNEHFEKFQWLAGDGQWRAHRPIDKHGNKVTTRGFYLSGLYNPWIEWDILVTEFIQAVRANEEGDVEPLKAFRNTRLGLLHEDVGQKVDVDLYHVRREVYAAEIPDGVIVLTAGVDVGERQLTYEIVGWGRRRESWGIEYGLIDGDPREQDVWDLLDDAIYHRLFKTHDGLTMRVRKIAVDSGYASDFVYAYTKPRQPRCVSIKGDGGLGKPFIKGAGRLTKFNRATLITLGVDAGKEEITNRLLVATVGPGYCHFPKMENGEPCLGYDEEYFNGLTAERRIVKAKNGFRTYMWMKRLSQRNEPFDCRNYALGALAIPSTGIKLDEMKRDIYAAPKKSDQPESQIPFGAQKERMYNIGGPATRQAPQGESKSKFGAMNRPLQ